MLVNSYHNAVRAQVDLLVRRSRTDKLVSFTVGTDEVSDPSLIALRVYGSRDDADIIMLCAGTNRIGEPLPRRTIYLPLPTSLAAIKRDQANNEALANE